MLTLHATERSPNSRHELVQIRTLCSQTAPRLEAGQRLPQRYAAVHLPPEVYGQMCVGQLRHHSNARTVLKSAPLCRAQRACPTTNPPCMVATALGSTSYRVAALEGLPTGLCGCSTCVCGECAKIRCKSTSWWIVGCQIVPAVCQMMDAGVDTEAYLSSLTSQFALCAQTDVK